MAVETLLERRFDLIWFVFFSFRFESYKRLTNKDNKQTNQPTTSTTTAIFTMMMMTTTTSSSFMYFASPSMQVQTFIDFYRRLTFAAITHQTLYHSNPFVGLQVVMFGALPTLDRSSSCPGAFIKQLCRINFFMRVYFS